MNWLIKFSKKIFIFFVIYLTCNVFAFSDVITGGVRREYNENQKKIEIPFVEPVYSTGSIMAYNAGVQYFDMQNYDKAIDSFISAVLQDQKFSDAYFNLGLIYYHIEKPSEAIVAFNRAYLLNKKDDEALFYMVKCYTDKGDKIAARYYAKKISQKSEFYTKAQEVLK